MRRWEGELLHINASDGGVPKLPLPDAEIDELGVVGDRQAHPEIHGGPERAVCVWSADLIERLRAEGHPIEPGCAGENLTLGGIDWALVRPGVRLEIGEGVVLETTRYTSPCKQIAHCFTNGRIGRISQKANPGSSRIYARVIQGGRVRTGDRVALVEWGAASSQGNRVRA